MSAVATSWLEPSSTATSPSYAVRHEAPYAGKSGAPRRSVGQRLEPAVRLRRLLRLRPDGRTRRLPDDAAARGDGMSALTEAHRQHLEDAAIDPALAEVFGVRSIRTAGDLPAEHRWCRSTPGLLFTWRSTTGD